MFAYTQQSNSFVASPESNDSNQFDTIIFPKLKTDVVSIL